MAYPKVIVEGKGIQVPQQLQIQISMSVTINVEPQVARRQVTTWLVSEVGNMLIGGEAKLVIGQQTVWRVPAILTSSEKGYLGVVGKVDVDVETGELLIVEGLREEILTHAQRIAGSTLSTIG